MKKTILVVSCLILLALGSSSLMAQEGLTPLPRVGVEGGINLASLTGPDVNAVYASRLGFVGGALGLGTRTQMPRSCR